MQFQFVGGMILSLFWDVAQRRLVVTDVAGQLICSILLGLLDP